MSSLPVLKLSATSIKTYEKCPRSWYYQYVKKVAVKKDFTHLVLGNFVHDVLEQFHNELLKDPLKDKTKLMSSCCQQIQQKAYKGKITTDIKSEAKEMLTTYLKKIYAEGLPNVVENERPFKICLSKDKNVYLSGKIDRIDNVNDTQKQGKKILDYKSGKSKYLDDFQLKVYAIAVMEDDPSIDSVVGSYLCLKEDCKEIPYKISKEDANKTKLKILEIAEQIREDKTWEPKPQFLCKWCDFYEICPDAYGKNANTTSSPEEYGEINW